jgi:hypothetical protein
VFCSHYCFLSFLFFRQLIPVLIIAIMNFFIAARAIKNNQISSHFPLPIKLKNKRTHNALLV